jgi:hypothetical protein
MGRLARNFVALLIMDSGLARRHNVFAVDHDLAQGGLDPMSILGIQDSVIRDAMALALSRCYVCVPTAYIAKKRDVCATPKTLNLNPEVEVWDTAPNNVGQAFQPAGSPDFPVRPWATGKSPQLADKNVCPTPAVLRYRWPTSEFRLNKVMLSVRGIGATGPVASWVWIGWLFRNSIKPI